MGVNAGISLKVVSQGARHSSTVVPRLCSHAYEESLLAAQETIANLIMPPKVA